MSQSGFKDIVFGNSDADNERIDMPELLLDGFIDEEGYTDKLIHERHFLVYGQKGSGKSALGSRLELISKVENIIVNKHALVRFNHKTIKDIVYDRETPISDSTRSWETILHVAFLEMFSHDDEISSQSKDEFDKLISELRKIGALPAEDLSRIVNKLSKKELTVDLRVVKFFRSVDGSSTYNNMYDNLRYAVNSVKPSKKHILIIDDLDNDLGRREDLMRSLEGLIRAADLINKDFRKRNISAKVVLLCRTDVLDMLNSSNLQRIIDDCGIELRWYQHNVDYLDINLIKLLNKRAEISLGDEIDIFHKYFPENVGNKMTYKYLLDYTRHLPRDVIRLINEVQKVYKPKMNENSFDAAVDEYSNKFFGEIRNELHGIIPPNDIDGIFRVLSGVKTYRTSVAEIKNTATELRVKVDIDKTLDALYRIGAIGNIRKVNGMEKPSFKYRDRHQDFNPTMEIMVHLALQRTLKLRGGYIQTKEIDYD